MAEQWTKFEMESKYKKFNTPGDEVIGRVTAIVDGRFGAEVSIAQATGKKTKVTCVSAQLRAWSEHIEVGEVWRIRFVSQDEGRDGQQGMKRFEFYQNPKQAKSAPRATAPVRGEGREPGDDNDLDDEADEPPFTRSP